MKKLSLKLFSSHSSLFLDKNVCLDARKRSLALGVFYFVFFAIMLTLIGQMPFFTQSGASRYFQLGWFLILIPMLMLDYKHLIKSILHGLLIVLPFVVYLIIACCCKINSISYGGTTIIFMSIFVMIIGLFLGKYFSSSFFRGISVAYIVGAGLYAIVVYFYYLKGSDLSNPIYAFNDKNSAGPIFLIAATLCLFLFQKRSVLSYVIRICLFCFFSLILALTKCRAAIVFLPILILIIHLFLPSTRNSKMLSRIIFPIAMVLGFCVVYFVPILHEKIIVNIILNNQKSFEDLFSGRIKQVVDAFKNFKPILGSGGTYVDCMPLSILLSYGVFGFISLLPVSAIPFYATIKSKSIIDRKLFVIICSILVMFVCNSLFEGNGYFGPGTKVFILWVFCGYAYGRFIMSPKETSLFKLIDKPTNIVNKLSPKAFLVLVQVFLIAGSGYLIYSKNIVNNVGERFVNVLPQSNKKGSFTEATHGSISKETMDFLGIKSQIEIGSMCLGQKIKFKADYSEGASDTYTAWKTAWNNPDYIDVNNATAVVTAVQSKVEGASTTVAYYQPLTNSMDRYAEFFIKNPEEYVFDKRFTKISTKPFKYSFQDDGVREITLTEGMTSKVYYDTNYIPMQHVNNNSGAIKLNFFTDNVNVADVDCDNGTIKAIKEGDARISYIVKNEPTGQVQTDPIIVHVIKAEKTLVEPIQFSDTKQLSKEAWEHEPYKVNYELLGKDGKIASDQGINITINNASNDLKYFIDEDAKEVTFENEGTCELIITSRSNKTLFKTVNLNVHKNKPIAITCDCDWLVIGEERKNSQELGLRIVFEHNKWSRFLEDNDLEYDPMSQVLHEENQHVPDRAWSGGNGFTRGTMTSVKGMVRGNFGYTYVLKLNPDVKYTMNITVSPFTKSYYNSLCLNSGLILLYLIIMLAGSFILFVDIKNKVVLIGLSILGPTVLGCITLLLYPINVITIILPIIYLVEELILALIRIFVLYNAPTKLVETDN